MVAQAFVTQHEPPAPDLGEARARELRRHWLLDPSVAFLNHGAFGACPTPVLELQSEYRARLEREPVQFLLSELPGLLDGAREAVARFVGARAEDVAFVRNATTGVNAVLRSLAFGSDAELLTTDHAYAACRNALDFVAAASGARVVVARVPLPIASAGEVTERVLAAVTPRTHLALLDHVTSPTGIVLPIAELVRELDARGVDTLVDGAHVPGMLPLDLERLGAAYYAANFHKWACAPKGAAMLWVRPDRQAGIHPAVISHGYASPRAERRSLEEFDWTGSDDPSPALCVSEALRFVASLDPRGFDGIYERNRALALEARRILARSLGRAPICPDSMLGSLAAVELPDRLEIPSPGERFDPLQVALLERHGVEVPVMPWPAPPARLLRVSAHLYNHEGEYRTLAAAVREELELGSP